MSVVPVLGAVLATAPGAVAAAPDPSGSPTPPASAASAAPSAPATSATPETSAASAAPSTSATSATSAAPEASGVPGASGAPARTYRIWHWNIAGSVVHQGAVANGLIPATTSSIVNRNPDFVSLNEVCFKQYEALKAALVGAGWPQDKRNFARFAQTRAPEKGVCGGSETFGNVLLSKRPLGASRQYALPTDGTRETRKMLCAPPTAQPRMKFCTVHITANTASTGGVPNNVRQLDRVRTLLDGFHRAGQTYVLAGDLNAQPHQARLNPFYAPSVNTAANPDNTGVHREVDDADRGHCPGYGEWTNVGPADAAPPCGKRAKIDQIFVRESALAGAHRGDSVAVPKTCKGVEACSNHRLLVGKVRLRVK